LNEFKRNIPERILDKDILTGNEFGCRKVDFQNVINIAQENLLAISGGQIQYALPDGTCELYWLAYDTESRKPEEAWKTYCERTAKESLEKFNSIFQKYDVEKEALENFKFLEEKKKAGIDISEFQTFVLYFEDENQAL
jgi:hypothetical protein